VASLASSDPLRRRATPAGESPGRPARARCTRAGDRRDHPVHGLRGLHPHPHHRGIRTNRDTGHPRYRPHRAPDHLRRADPLPGLHRPRRRARHRRRILSTGLAAGIIIDATIIRGILAPALVALLGQINWWLPAAIARLLHVTPLNPRTTASRHHATTGTAPAHDGRRAQPGGWLRPGPALSSQARALRSVISRIACQRSIPSACDASQIRTSGSAHGPAEQSRGYRPGSHGSPWAWPGDPLYPYPGTPIGAACLQRSFGGTACPVPGQIVEGTF
jgi:hypothetical protein